MGLESPQPIEQIPPQEQVAPAPAETPQKRERPEAIKVSYEKYVELHRRYNEALETFNLAQAELHKRAEVIAEIYNEGGLDLTEKLREANKKADEAVAAYRDAQIAVREAIGKIGQSSIA